MTKASDCAKLGPWQRHHHATRCDSISRTAVTPRTKKRQKTERPRLYKLILLNDDNTPREFVIKILRPVFRMSDEQAYHVMMTMHKFGTCVVAVYTQDVARTKATESIEAGRRAGHPLTFTTEPEDWNVCDRAERTATS